jgi:hypothetical protein
MSNSFVAGQRLTAQRMPWQRVWSVSSTTATAAITSITAILTSPAQTYLANSAYMIQYTLLTRTTASAPMAASIEIRDTNTAGTQRMGTRLYQVAGNTANYAADGLWPIANTTSNDITGRVLALCGTASTGSFLVNASSVLPYFMTCYYVGLSSDYPEAVAL